MKKSSSAGRVRRRRLPRRQCWAIGDPQTTFDKLIRILDHHGLIGRGGALKTTVSLLSIGDHFDFTCEEGPVAAGEEGLRILRWLASHPEDQAIILAGNHDLARVMELGVMTDERFQEARARALEVDRHPHDSPRRRELETQFSADFPDLPTSEAARRDYQSFTARQRTLVQELLSRGRMKLAQAALEERRPVLLTHAAVTQRELDLLGIGTERGASRIAERLNQYLAHAVLKARAAWDRGRLARLELDPLHAPGGGGREGGGLLYHRPASLPDTASRAPRAPRRFHPKALPRPLVQACGHTVHPKCLEEKLLGPWASPSAHRPDLHELRALRVSESEIVYEAKSAPPRDGEAFLYMIDGGMNGVTQPHDYPLLRLDSWI
jgi:hypothetical protein